MSLKLNSSGGGSVTLQEPVTASTLTLNLPATLGNTGNNMAVTSDASGNLGLGVTPSAWSSSGNIQLPANGMLTANGTLYLLGNAYFNSNFKYTTSAAASQYAQGGGAHYWYNAPSGTAGNAISFTQAMMLGADGGLLVGTTSNVQAARLNVQGGYIYLKETGGGDIYFRSGYNGTDPAIQVVSSSPLLFLTANTERVRVTPSGYFKASNTGAYGNVAGSYHEFINNQNNTALYVGNTNTSSGAVCYYSKLESGATGFHGQAQTGGAIVYQVLASGNVQNTNNSYGSLSDAKLKENVTDATPKLEKLNQVRVVNYNLIGNTQKQIGVIAQELEQVFPGMVEESPDRDTDGNDLGTTTKSVKYSVFVPMLVKAIQEQQAMIAQLQADIASLKGTA